MSKKNPYIDLLTPKGKKTLAKKAVQKVAAKAAEKTTTKVATKAVTKMGLKTGSKVGAKVASKTFLRSAANPYLLLADGVELGVGALCKKLDLEEEDSRILRKGSGLTTSITIGTIVGGPLGATAGAMIWGIGEAASKLFDWD